MAEAKVSVFQRKKAKKEEGGPAIDKDAWMVTFSDLLQLLITFFVLLISMSSMDTKVIKEMFTVFTGALGVLNFSDKTEVMPPAIKPFVVPPSLKVQDFVLFLRLESLHFETRVPTEDDLVEIVTAMVISGVEITKRGKDFSLLLSDESLFEQGGVEIKASFKPVLQRISSVLAIGKNKIIIEGHTDDQEHQSRLYPSNWELSAARANSVRDYLLSLGEVEAERVDAKGFASYHPKVKNVSEVYRKRNRRVEVLIKQYVEKSF